QTLKAAARQSTDVPGDAAAPPDVFAPPIEQPKPTSSASSGGTTTALRIGAIAAGGVGVAGMVRVFVAGPTSLGTFSDLEKRRGKNTPCPAALQGEVSRGKTEQTVANVGLALG